MIVKASAKDGYIEYTYFKHIISDTLLSNSVNEPIYEFKLIASFYEKIIQELILELDNYMLNTWHTTKSIYKIEVIAVKPPWYSKTYNKDYMKEIFDDVLSIHSNLVINENPINIKIFTVDKFDVEEFNLDEIEHKTFVKLLLENLKINIINYYKISFEYYIKNFSGQYKN